MRTSPLKILLFSLFIPLTAALSAQNTQPGVSSLSLTISAPKAVVKAGAPVKVKITTTNTSDGEVAYYEYGFPWHYHIYVRDATGAYAPDTPEGLRKHPWSPHRTGGGAVFSGPSFRSQLTIGPGKKQEDDVDVTKEYDLSKPGKYSVQVERPDPENKGQWLKSNTITITVTP